MDRTLSRALSAHPIRLWRRLSLMAAAARQRRALARLESRLLDDIGRSADEARAETARPVWDVPVQWLR